MSRGFSGAPGGIPVVTRVQWFDPRQGFGFLVRGQGLPEVFCHISVVREAGLNTLTSGAVVICEVVRGAEGLQASKILTVDAAPGLLTPSGRDERSRSESPQGNRNVQPGYRVTALVKRFSSTGGYGFLLPDDGSPDIFCHVTVLQEAGYGTLPPGAAVTCEVVVGAKGPQVSRVLAAHVPVQSSDPLPCDGYMLGEGGAARSDRQSAPPRPLQAQVKWFNPSKGYGFLVPEDGSAEVFCHISDVREAGYGTLSPGEMVTCEVMHSAKGACVSRILALSEAVVRNGGPSDRPVRTFFGECSQREDEPAVSTDSVSGTVKFYNIRKGFGFVVSDGGGGDILVPEAVLSNSGLEHLAPGLRVSVKVVENPAGLQATGIDILLESERDDCRRARSSPKAGDDDPGGSEPSGAAQPAPATPWRLRSNRRSGPGSRR